MRIYEKNIFTGKRVCVRAHVPKGKINREKRECVECLYNTDRQDDWVIEVETEKGD